MSEINNDISVDGRLTVLLFFMFGLMLFDFTYQYNWSLFTSPNDCDSAGRLSFVAPNKLFVEKCSDVGRKHVAEAVPAIYTPFFFELIPINMADKDMLMSVQGIGPAMADDIVDYRQKFGPIRKSIDLQKIKGIGAKRAARFETVFTFAEAP